MLSRPSEGTRQRDVFRVGLGEAMRRDASKNNHVLNQRPRGPHADLFIEATSQFDATKQALERGRGDWHFFVPKINGFETFIVSVPSDIENPRVRRKFLKKYARGAFDEVKSWFRKYQVKQSLERLRDSTTALTSRANALYNQYRVINWQTRQVELSADVHQACFQWALGRQSLALKLSPRLQRPAVETLGS
jgi:hypothetical protein